MTTPALPDQDARREAATRFDCNLAVTAGAGTGKTSLLVERFLNLILSGAGSLSETTAITFTEKAAMEMKTRVAAALDAIGNAGSGNTAGLPQEAVRSAGWLQEEQGLAAADLRVRARENLENLDSAFIGTIHSFCSEILRRHPLAADIPPEFAVDDGLAQHAAFDEDWLEFLTEEFGAPTRDRLWREVLAVFTENEIEDVARALALCPPACDLLARTGYRALDARDFFTGKIATLRAELEQGLEETSHRTGMPLFLKSALLVLDLFLKEGSAGLAALDPDTLPFEEFWEKGVPSAGAHLSKKRQKEIKDKATEARGFLKDLQKVDENAIGNLMEALRPFARTFRARVHQEGLLSYDDLLLVTRNLLVDRPDIRKRESRRHRFVLVDEFQDTDPLQYEILFLLARKEDDGNGETTPEPGRLFVVGDPKQSIYRFRGADISAFLEARARIADEASPVSLTTNFRSRPGILAAVNLLFESWMGPDTEEELLVEPEYEPLNPHREAANEKPCVEMWSIPTPEKANADKRREEEAHQIAAAIRGWKKEGIHDYGDVAVLFRSLIDIPIYVRALRDAGIDFVVDGGKAFSERQEVVESFALLRSLANPADPVAVLGVLRSPMGGASDAEILSFVRKKGRMTWMGTGNPVLEEFPAIQRAFGFLKTWDKHRRRLPLDRWVIRLLTESEYMVLTSAHFEGPQRAANVRKLAEMIATLIRERGLTLEQAVDSLELEFARERTEGESPLADEAVNAVRILSMHKAKGLEYPAVILPDLGRQKPSFPPETKVRLLRTRDGSFPAVEVKARDWLRNTAAVRAIQEDKVHETAEDKRILYVAATRARERLVLVNSGGGSRRNEWIRALEQWDYRISPRSGGSPFPAEGPLAGSLVLHRVMAAGEIAGEGRAVSPGDLSSRVTAFLAAGKKAGGYDQPRFRHPSGDDHAESLAALPSDGTPAAPRDRDLARAAGAVVHRLLETWDFGDPAPLRERVPRVSRAIAPGYGAPAEAVEKEVSEILRGFLDSSLPRHLSQAVILGREVPLLYRDDHHVVVYGYADLIYRKDGVFHVADYKTDDHPSEERAAMYQGQLLDYGNALRRAWNLDSLPVLEVLFVRTGERVRLSPTVVPQP